MASASKAFLSRNTSLLMNKGFQFFTTTSGAEVLKLNQEHRFDLILSELKLEDMDGCKLCSEIYKTDDPEFVPVIIICHDTVQHIQQVKQSRAAAILLRPINPTHLLITIGSFIDMQLARSMRVEFNALVLLKESVTELCSNSMDISATGIRISTEYQFDVGTKISCQFVLPDICEVEAEAEVVNVKKVANDMNVYGTRFIGLPLPVRSSIEKYVAVNRHLGIKQVPHRPLERSITIERSPF